MATVRIVHNYGGERGEDHASTWFEADVEPSYPDYLDQARATVMRMYRDSGLLPEDADTPEPVAEGDAEAG